ncbi:MAG: phosphatidylserine decarboxylase [Gammaproteobacteria bacterium GWE2_37_16]|nr:MAG: phosphatidylserine decarboxylase [Gammaproteobacteria bacterium GWE2_37_16]
MKCCLNSKCCIFNEVFLQYLLPKRLLSKIVGGLMRCRNVWLKNLLIDWFANHYQIDMHDAIESDPHAYPSLEDFFIRKVKSEARPFVDGKKEISCPVDGEISQAGEINTNTLLQAKGKEFHLVDLLGGDQKRAKNFASGSFVTIYLAPHDYHRVYMPYDGVLKEMIYIPGRLFSVNAATSSTIDNLYARNERLVLFFETSFGPMAMVLVGALIVAGLNTSWAGKVGAEKTTTLSSWTYDEKHQISLKRSDEVGYFTFGSTVILLFPEGKVNWNKRMVSEKIVEMGQLLGMIMD